MSKRDSGQDRTTVSGANSRAVWLKHLHRWHWISSALALLGMLLFSVTGITLNHASQIEARPTVTARNGILPAALQADLRARVAAHEAASAPLPPSLRQWVADALAVRIGDEPADWSDDEVYLSLPRAGGDAWLRIGVGDGKVEYELTQRGWIAWLNDLHKGRHTGAAWRWFIDVFAAACLIFALTGLLILKLHAASRPMTWPVVGLGVLIPVLLMLLFIH